MRFTSETPTVAPDFPRPLHWPSWFFPLLSVLLALSLIPFATPIAQALPPFFGKLHLADGILGIAKQFGMGLTITSVCVVIWVQDQRRRHAILVLIIAAGITAAACHTVKQLSGRARPFNAALLRESGKNLQWSQNYVEMNPEAGYVAESRDQWLGFNPARAQNSGHFDSFPSGHTCAAFLLAAFLTALYP